MDDEECDFTSDDDSNPDMKPKSVNVNDKNFSISRNMKKQNEKNDQEDNKM